MRTLLKSMWNCKIAKNANCNLICKSAVFQQNQCELRNSFKFSNSFSAAGSSSLRVLHGVGAGKTFTVSCWWYGNNPFWVTAAARALASLPAIPSPSATAASSPTCHHPVPPSVSLAAPRNQTEREAVKLAERYPSAVVIKHRALATVANCGVSMCLP